MGRYKGQYMWYQYLLFLLIACVPAQAREITKPRVPNEKPNKPTYRPKKNVPAPTDTPKKTKRKGLQGLAYREPKKTYSQMGYDELCVLKDNELKKQHTDAVIIILERMMPLCDDINKKAEDIIQLADLYLDKGLYEDAAKWYKEFTTLYPGNKNIEYATYKAIVCSSKTILSFDRDQTPTEQTIELADNFLERSDVFTQYADHVRDIRRNCYKTLADSECNVGSFYIKQGDYKAAQLRLEGIRKDWLFKLPELETELALLEVELGIQYKEFTIPESSLKIAQLVEPKKVDLVARF